MNAPRFLRQLAWISVASPALVLAQISPDSREDEPVVLSPFVVESSDNQGYQATATLAGSRLKTQLKDVASSISVLTPELLEDVGANNIETALVFIANAETNASFEQAGNAAGGYLGGDFADSNRQPANTRIRGLSAADITQDFFLVANNNVDTYNTERLTLVRGPNSILFGLGSPAGIIDQTTKRANLSRNANEVQVRVERYGSLRATADFNRVLLKDKLAVRIVGLRDDKKTQFESTYDRDNRVFGAVTYKPFANTTVRINAEKINNRARRPRWLTPQDNISGWIAAGRPTFNPVTNGTRAIPAFTALAGLDAQSNGAMLVFNEGTSESPDFSIWTAQSSPVTGPATRFLARSSDPTENTPFYVDRRVSDERIFPFLSHDLGAIPGAFQDRLTETGTITIEQKITDDLQFEVAYFRSYHRDNFYSPIQALTNAISIDVNEVLANGAVNPNFLRPYISGLDIGNNLKDERNSFRFTGFYNLDLTRQPSWLKWLGRHQISGIYSTLNITNRNYSYRYMIMDSLPFQGLPADSAQNNRRWVQKRWYVGPAFTAGQAFPTYTGFPQSYFPPNTSFPIQIFNPTTAQWGTTTLTTQENNFNQAQKRRDENSGYGAAAQSFFWNDRIVTTLGWRHDENTNYFAPTKEDGVRKRLLDDVNWAFDPARFTKSSGDTMTTAVVFHATNWLSLHFNRSENLTPSGGEIDVFSRLLPPSSGQGKDYGATFTFLDGKFTARINFFDMQQKNARDPSTRFIAFNNLQGQEDRIYNHLLALGRLNEYVAPPANYAGAAPALQETTSFDATGKEFEVTYNPTKNWRIAINAAEQKTVETNKAAATREYIELRLPFWSKFDAEPFQGTGTLLGTTYTNVIGVPLANALISEGRNTQSQARWRANLITNYVFSSDRLKGVGVGAALRWQDRRALGYPLIVNANGSRSTDLENPFMSDTQLNGDVWLSYSRRNIMDGIDWKVQLNVRNIIGEKGLVPTRINPNGQTAGWSIARDTLWQLTNTFSF